MNGRAAALVLLALLPMFHNAWGAVPPGFSDEQRRRLETSIAEKAALKVMDDFLAAFNARDLDAWRATLNYPHIRFASGGVDISLTPDEYASDDTFERLEAGRWDHSRWTDLRIIQSGPEKVHVAVRFTRFDRNDRPLASYDSLYVITLQGDHWGIISRSSFAP